MRKTILFVIALLLVCSGAEARGKKKKQQSAKASQIAWTAFSDYMFHEGTAVLKGRLKGYAEGKRPTVIELIHYNHFFSGEQSVEAIPVESDGTFYSELYLTHSQFACSPTLQTDLFLTVGDTLSVEFDQSKYDDDLWKMPQPYRFSGNATPVQVNTHWNLLEHKHYANEPSRAAMFNRGTEGVHRLMQYYGGRLDTLSQLIAEYRLELPSELTPQAREVLQYGLLSKAYTDAVDVRFDYMMNDIDSTETKKEVLQSEAFTRVFSKYESLVLNTPMILLNPDGWVPFNRLFLDQYRDVYLWGLRNLNFDTDSLVAVASTQDTTQLVRQFISAQIYRLWPRYYNRSLDGCACLDAQRSQYPWRSLSRSVPAPGTVKGSASHLCYRFSPCCPSSKNTRRGGIGWQNECI